MTLIMKLKYDNIIKSNLDTRLSIILVTFNAIGIISIFDNELLFLLLIFHLVLFFFLPQKSSKQLLVPLIFISFFLFLMYFIEILSIAEFTIGIMKLYNLNILFTCFYL